MTLTIDRLPVPDPRPARGVRTVCNWRLLALTTAARQDSIHICAVRSDPMHARRGRNRALPRVTVINGHACMHAARTIPEYVRPARRWNGINQARACVPACMHAARARQQLAPAVERPRGRHWRAHMPCHAMPCIVWGRLRRAPTSLTTGRGPISSLQVSLLRLLSLVSRRPKPFLLQKKRRKKQMLANFSSSDTRDGGSRLFIFLFRDQAF